MVWVVPLTFTYFSWLTNHYILIGPSSWRSQAVVFIIQVWNWRTPRKCAKKRSSVFCAASSHGFRGAKPPRRSAPSSGNSSIPSAETASSSALYDCFFPTSIARGAPTASRSRCSPPASLTPSACPRSLRTPFASSTGGKGVLKPAPMLEISPWSPLRWVVLSILGLLVMGPVRGFRPLFELGFYFFVFYDHEIGCYRSWVIVILQASLSLVGCIFSFFLSRFCVVSNQFFWRYVYGVLNYYYWLF